MPLDLHGFYEEPNQWEGLFKFAEIMAKNRARQDQLAHQEKAQRAASGSFLQNYLDPKDYLSGTQFDPMILQGLESAKQEGTKLAMKGADAPTLMTALGPMVNKLSTYSLNAKSINKNIDDQIKTMRESGLTGYDYNALRNAALQNAFYKQDDKGHQTLIDPSELNPNENYIAKAIEANPSKVTTAAGLDLFAKNSPMQKLLYDQTNYDRFGNMDKSKVHLIGQNWLQPEYDTDPRHKGQISGLVPKYDLATDGNNYLNHNFTDELGNTTNAPIRLLKEDVFDDMMQRRPDIADYMKGIVQQHIGEFKDKDGRPISMNDPRAKLVARAMAYDELNRRKTGTIERADIADKPSGAMVNLNVQSLPQYAKTQEELAAARKQGRADVTDPNDVKQYKRNVGQVFGDIFNGNEDLSGNDKMKLNGTIYMPDGTKKAVKDRTVIDITGSMPGGGLKSGRGEDFKYKGIYFDPQSRSVIMDEVSGPEGNKSTKSMEVPENKFGQWFLNNAEANGVPKAGVRMMLDKMGYKNGKFNNAQAPATPAPFDPAKDFSDRKGKSWRSALNPFQ